MDRCDPLLWQCRRLQHHQPEQTGKFRAEKADHIRETGANVVADANPGCHLQIENRLGEDSMAVGHPVSLLAASYRAERGS